MFQDFLASEIAIIVFFNTFFFGVLISMLLRTRPIDKVEDNNGNVIFRIYQKGINGFLVKGYRGNYRKVSFKTYVDVVAYVDKRVNGWI